VDLAQLERSQRINTQRGARTGPYVPELDPVFVAARGVDAALVIYRPQP
jgi:hypothetical protein